MNFFFFFLFFFFKATSALSELSFFFPPFTHFIFKNNSKDNIPLNLCKPFPLLDAGSSYSYGA